MTPRKQAAALFRELSNQLATAADLLADSDDAATEKAAFKIISEVAGGFTGLTLTAMVGRALNDAPFEEGPVH